MEIFKLLLGYSSDIYIGYRHNANIPKLVGSRTEPYLAMFVLVFFSILTFACSSASCKYSLVSHPMCSSCRVFTNRISSLEADVGILDVTSEMSKTFVDENQPYEHGLPAL